jgi:hypothetical protein
MKIHLTVVMMLHVDICIGTDMVKVMSTFLQVSLLNMAKIVCSFKVAVFCYLFCIDYIGCSIPLFFNSL